MEFYLWVDEQQQGPFTEQDLRKRLASGELTQETNAWRAGLREWLPLADVLAQQEAQVEQTKIKASGKSEPLKMTRSHSGAAPVLKVGSGSTQAMAKATSLVRAGTSPVQGQVAAKTVSIQGSLKRGLAADLSQSAAQTQLLSSATSNLVPHSATQQQTVRVTGATSLQYEQTPAAQGTATGEEIQGNGKAVAGFVLGLLSVLIAPLSFLALVGFFFSFLGRKNPHRALLNLWGLILNILGLTLFLASAIALMFLFPIVKEFFSAAWQQGTDQVIPEQERIEKAVVEAVESWASENNGRAPRGSIGQEIVEELGYQEKVIYLKTSGAGRYQLKFAGDDGLLDTEDDYISPQQIR